MTDKSFELTPDNTKVVVFGEPYEELSCAVMDAEEGLYFFWDCALMDTLVEAGVEVVELEEPDEIIIEEYAHLEAEHATEEWYATG